MVRTRRVSFLGLMVALLTSTSGCIGGVQHNDVLLFGVDTKLALDVSASAAQGGVPEVTIGYKRTEAVWMPLIVNGRGVETAGVQALCNAGQPDTASCPGGLDRAKYVGEGEKLSDGGSGGGQDSYSVFASFGAQIRGRANTGAEGEVGLAQFFATGIAAQRLASAERVEQLVSLQSPASAAAAAAAAAAAKPTDAEILIEAELIKARQARANSAENAAACAKLRNSAFAPEDFPEAMRTDNFLRDVKAARNASQFQRIIEEYPSAATEFDKAVEKHCKV